MSGLKENLNKLIETELKEVEVKKAELLTEIETLEKQSLTLKSDTDKEIAQKKAQCEIECNENLNTAAALLKEAKDKNDTANKREEDSLAIEKQIKDLAEKTKTFKDTEKQLAAAKASCIEREEKAKLIIAQYEKKLEDLNKK